MQFVYALMIARQRRREIKAKSVNVHVFHPVTETVGHQLQRARMKQIEGVARAGEVQVEARILRIQPVISEIVDPAEAKRGAELISFRGMIVNHIENHFDSGSVKAAHHRLELGDLLAQLPATGVLRMRREKS